MSECHGQMVDQTETGELPGAAQAFVRFSPLKQVLGERGEEIGREKKIVL